MPRNSQLTESGIVYLGDYLVDNPKYQNNTWWCLLVWENSEPELHHFCLIVS